jgi:hypothetical protein
VEVKQQQTDRRSEAARGGLRRWQLGIGAGLATVVGAAAVANFGPNPAVVGEAMEAGITAESTPAEAEVPVDATPALAEEEPSEQPGSATPALRAHEFEPLPASLRVPKPEAVRGIYLNAWAAGSQRKLERLMQLARETEINAFVIDVKEVGEISYRSAVPLAGEIGARRNYIPNVRRVLDQLRENGIYPIARIVVFRDEVLAKARPDLAIVREDGSIWVDNYDHYWVDSYNREVWDYNIALAREAIELGFSEIQWDYVRFPDVPQSLMRTAVWPAQAGRSKEDAIREFLLYAREQLSDLGAPVTADVFGLTVSTRNDMGIGQQWEKMVDAVDAILPMVYPSHYALGSYGISYPNARPYELIKTTLGHAVRRSAAVANAGIIRPWLQDFTLGQPRYGPAHVRAQIRAVYDAGLTEWVLWNPGSNYTEGALAKADGREPDLPIPDADIPPRAPRDTVRRDTTPTAPRLLGSPVTGG